MRAKSASAKKLAEQMVKDIRRATRRHFSAEGKIRIVLEGLHGEDSIAKLCRKKGIAQREACDHARYTLKTPYRDVTTQCFSTHRKNKRAFAQKPTQCARLACLITAAIFSI